MIQNLFSKELKPGDFVRHYIIEKKLGSGSFGITYLAKNTRNDEPVALKEFFPVLFDASKGC